MITTAPPERVQSLVWSWDWLGNMTEWSDDAQQFYERSIGDITNGQDVAERPSALYVASSVDPDHPAQSGWVELDYGVGGNVTAVTVHGQCTVSHSISMGDPCADATSTADHQRCELRIGLLCASEQHYQYRWDELNRIREARRFDRAGGPGPWTIEARQRYVYDGANVRVVKQSFDTSESAGGLASNDQRVALYVYPGDFERRGLGVVDMQYAAVTPGSAGTETQYLVAGARMVWDHGAPVGVEDGGELERDWRATIPVGDLLHTTSASVDLISGELLEVSTYYPNGARETLLVDEEGEGETELPGVPLEPAGFTGKEADEDVGLVFFGARYLLPRLGRWASPDPISLHMTGDGGEALNSYHYVSGNVLQAIDPLGFAEHELAEGEVDAGIVARQHDDFIHSVEGQLRRWADPLNPLEYDFWHIWHSSRTAALLIDHYMIGHGETYHLDVAEMQEIHAELSLTARAPAPEGGESQPNEFEQLVERLAAAGGDTQEVDLRLAAEAHTSGTLGHFQAHYVGTVEVDAHGRWSFDGTVQFEDTFDFDLETERDPRAQAQCIAAHYLMPGDAAGFQVTSDAIHITQRRHQAHVQFVGTDKPYSQEYGGGSVEGDALMDEVDVIHGSDD